MEIRNLIGQELKKYTANQLIPSERYLALKYNCSRETVRKAYEQLRAEDKIYKVQNIGWFVSNKKIQYYPASIENFNSYLKAQGFAAKTELISAKQTDASFTGADLFDSKVRELGFFEIIRLRYADNVPVLLEYNYLPASIFPNFLNFDVIPSVEEVVKNNYNLQYSSSQLKIKNTAAEEFDGKQLGIPSSQTAIRIERISKSDDQVIEFDVEIWPEDKIEMILDIKA
ncbi:GntR family transcriptional regulator [Acinetobacter pragensis]|nr:GntR family transcriptional regulator [Acinetobacter pragensis]